MSVPPGSQVTVPSAINVSRLDCAAVGAGVVARAIGAATPRQSAHDTAATAERRRTAVREECDI
ncbi:hypothetical protein GCM10023217_11640 [Gordonia alkaliphila]|uniref:Uncharacterized protein n=1 Tax=Gordonia alkaliphila TaxID=1053547 RepID=A0ABP8Z2B6_9ACTN